MYIHVVISAHICYTIHLTHTNCALQIHVAHTHASLLLLFTTQQAQRVLHFSVSLTLGTHAPKGYGTLSLCLFVFYHSVRYVRRLYSKQKALSSTTLGTKDF